MIILNNEEVDLDKVVDLVNKSNLFDAGEIADAIKGVKEGKRLEL